MDSWVLVNNALSAVHKHTFDNAEEIGNSSKCFCIYCKKDFTPSEVVSYHWRGRGSPIAPRRGAKEEKTALCPHCGVDSVLGDACGYEITPALLDALHDHWFERTVLPEDFNYDWFNPID